MEKLQIIKTLREYKNQTLNSSDDRLDSLIPDIIDFISQNEILNNEFNYRLKLFDEILHRDYYKDWLKGVVERFNRAGKKFSIIFPTSNKNNILDILNDDNALRKTSNNKQRFSNLNKADKEFFHKKGCLFVYLLNFLPVELLYFESSEALKQYKKANMAEYHILKYIIPDIISNSMFQGSIDFKVISSDINNADDTFKDADITRSAMYAVLVSLEENTKSSDQKILSVISESNIKQQSEQKPIVNKKKTILYYNKENNNFTLAGQPFNLKPYLISFLKDVDEHACEFRRKGAGKLPHYKVQQWKSYKTFVNKEARVLINQNILDKDYTFLVEVRGLGNEQLIK